MRTEVVDISIEERSPFPHRYSSCSARCTRAVKSTVNRHIRSATCPGQKGTSKQHGHNSRTRGGRSSRFRARTLGRRVLTSARWYGTCLSERVVQGQPGKPQYTPHEPAKIISATHSGLDLLSDSSILSDRGLCASLRLVAGQVDGVREDIVDSDPVEHELKVESLYQACEVNLKSAVYA